jgi:hypothetical protein
VTGSSEDDARPHAATSARAVCAAARWQPGDRVQILYLPDRDYDSVIISTR